MTEDLAGPATDWTLTALARALRARKVSPVEVAREYLERIERLDGRLRAFISVDADGALAAARALESTPATGPLHGVPLAYKDLCRVRGLPSSCGTRTPQYFAGDPECTAVARLRAAGAVAVGTLNMSELALGPFGDNPHHGNPQNPWQAGHVTGGSSSGSGGAVAARLVAGALGTDTGGSIRLPAACCGIVGLKPTYGRVSRAGVMPLSWSLDHLGPMTRAVRDAALLLGVIAGHDPRDATSSRRPVPDYAAELDRPVRGLRVGLVDNYYFDGVAPAMADAVRAAARALAGLGARVEPLRVPDPVTIAGAANVIARSESAAVHVRVLRERPHELGPAVRARLEVGLRVSAHDYLQASRLRARLARAFIEEVFAEVDAVLAPVIPEPAPAYAAVTAGGVDEVVGRMGRFSRLTRPFNGLGLPALALPCGRADGLPLALQIVGRPFDEATVLRLGHALEQAQGGAPRAPVE
jgi:aspartyl-tRNA(Asn)/glutamyl-tRNA(Gln) amidotransferase subunit A